jgi:hypothetical protein
VYKISDCLFGIGDGLRDRARSIFILPFACLFSILAVFGRRFGREGLLLLPVAVFEVAEKGVVGKKILVSFAGWMRIEFLLLFLLLLRVQTAHMEGL